MRSGILAETSRERKKSNAGCGIRTRDLLIQIKLVDLSDLKGASILSVSTIIGFRVVDSRLIQPISLSVRTFRTCWDELPGTLFKLQPEHPRVSVRVGLFIEHFIMLTIKIFCKSIFSSALNHIFLLLIEKGHSLFTT